MTTPPPDAVFTPPAGYEFEPELRGPSPRELPDDVGQGLHAQRRRRLTAGLAVGGVLSLGLGGMPFVNALAVYIVPLGYLSWIGAGLLAMSCFAMLKDRFTEGPYLYIREGQPLVARVVELFKAATVTVEGQPSRYAYTAVIEVLDPVTGVVARHSEKTSEFIDQSAYQTSFRVGDYVTAIYLPNQYPASLRLYAFLDLMPGLGLVAREKGNEKNAVWTTLLGIVMFFGFFLALFWNIYAHGRYEPIAFEHRLAMWPMIAGAVILGGGMFLGLWLHGRRVQRRRLERNALAAAAGQAIEVGEATVFEQRGLHGWFLKIVLPLGSLLLGGLTALCWCYTINACLDTSAPEMRPAIITNMTMTTHSFLFRHYDIEYTIPPDASKMKFLTTPDHMAGFDGPLGMAEIHQGYLGWPWVKDIHPLRVDAAKEH